MVRKRFILRDALVTWWETITGEIDTRRGRIFSIRVRVLAVWHVRMYIASADAVKDAKNPITTRYMGTPMYFTTGGLTYSDKMLSFPTEDYLQSVKVHARA